MELPKKAGRPKQYSTASERQRAYRERCKYGESGIATTTDDPKQGAKRLDVLLPYSTALALDRLAKHQQHSKAATLTKLIGEAEAVITKNMTDEERNFYFING